VLWLAARLTAAVTGGHVTGFGFGFAADVARGHLAAAWPGTSTPLVITVTALTAAAAAAAAGAAWARWGPMLMHAPDDPAAALARHRRAHATRTAASTTRRAAQLRASLRDRPHRDIGPGDAGMVLGDLIRPGRPPGPCLYSSWQDTELDFMGPRAGKTTARAIPLTLDAPGPVLATSNKADLWAATAAIRAEAGPVWPFDPCGILYQPPSFWVHLLAEVTNVETAHRLASHFVLTVEDPGKRELWGPAAQTLLTCLFLAASTSGRTLDDVALWLDQPSMPAPASLLTAAGYTALASSLVGTQNGAPETRDGIYETARTAAKALRDRDVMRWVTPQPGLPAFSPSDFPCGRGTLYLLSETRSYAAPLIAAVTDLVIRAGIRHAQRAGGRLDPPMALILDEAANICRIADLPDLYSFLGSHGICPVTILQSYEQGITVWGEHGMATMWGAATKKIIGAGVDSPRLARDLATLVGQHDVPVRTVSYGDGRASESVSLRRQDILEPAAIRALPPGTGLLLATGIKPALIHLTPWYAGPRAAEITAAQQAAQEQIREQAIQADPWYRDQSSHSPF
jgi:type IV secretory pathway TraG/TraD family ATPase VirD4